MIIKTLDMKACDLYYAKLVENNFTQCFELNASYEELREKILFAWKKNKEETNNISQKYLFDLLMAKDFYLIFTEYFDDVTIGDYDFWRYISICLIPDLVYERWGNKTAHFYKRPGRIYPYTLYWYFKLSWQGSVDKTVELLKSPNCTTDTIIQCVERTGTKGVDIDFFNTLMRQYCNDTSEGDISKSELFRKIQFLHTARSVNIIPEACKGGMEGYVKGLFDAVKDNK